MSIRAMVWALDTPVGDHKAKLVLIAMADNADDEKFQCWPSVDHLAHRCEMGRSTVYRCIIHLSTLGLIQHEKRRNTIGVPRQPLFTLNVPVLVPNRDNIVPAVGLPNPTAGTSNEPSLEPSQRKKAGNVDLKKEPVPFIDGRIWIEVGTAEWRLCEARWLKERGVRPQRHNDKGWWFPSDWLKAA